MTRILHLAESRVVGAASAAVPAPRCTLDFQTQRCLEYLSQRLGDGFDVELATVRGLLATIRYLRTRRDVDVAHVWDSQSLTAAALGFRCRILYTPPAELRLREVRWLRAIMAYRDLHVLCPTTTMHRALIARGIAPDRCTIIRPGVDFARINQCKNPQLRQSLGFSPDDCVLLAVGESTPSANHDQAAWAAAILQVLNPRYKLLLWGRGGRVPAIKHFTRRVTPGTLLHIAEERLRRAIDFEHLLSVADIALHTATTSAATLPLAICMAAGIPIVSTVTSAAAELLEDHHTAIFAPRNSPRILAQHILQLQEDRALQLKLSAAARAEAYRLFPLTKFLADHRDVYQRGCLHAPLTVALSS